MKKDQIQEASVIYDPDDFRPYFASTKMFKGSFASNGIRVVEIQSSKRIYVVLTAKLDSKGKVKQTIFDGLHTKQNVEF